MVHVRRLQESQAVTAEIEHVAIAHSLDRSLIAPMRQVDCSAEFACDKHRTGCVREEAVHPAALVRFEMGKHDIGQALWIEYLFDCATYRVVRVMIAGVD